MRYGFLITNDNDVLIMDQSEPTSYQEAINSPDSEKWQEAMKSEMQSMYDNQVWTLINPTDSLKTIGCKWIFKKILTWMAMCVPIKQDWLQKVSDKHMV